MISKNDLKSIKSLKVKKYRLREKRFLVEGAKNVLELVKSAFDVELILGTDEFIGQHKGILNAVPLHQVTEKVLREVGTFQSNKSCLAVGKLKEYTSGDLDFSRQIFMLDGVGDPGNLGTIIRTLDWFGYDQLVCSEDSADFYNPKVINSTMGSFSRVKVVYLDLLQFLKECDMPTYATAMDGKNLYQEKIKQPSILVMGSESHGISEEVLELVKNRITIPGKGKAESLNVAVSTGLVAGYLSQP